jgi:hypothetical protein
MFVGHLSADNRGHSPPLSPQQVQLPLQPLLITRLAYICESPLTAMSVESMPQQRRHTGRQSFTSCSTSC